MSLSLKSVPIFAGLEECAVAILYERATPTEAKSGDVIVTEGDVGNTFYLIESGSVKVVKRYKEAGEVTLAQLGRGEFFGEMCILETLPRSASVVACEQSTLLGIPALAFYHLYKKMPEQHSVLVLNIARDLSRRLRALDQRFASTG